MLASTTCWANCSVCGRSLPRLRRSSRKRLLSIQTIPNRYTSLGRYICVLENRTTQRRCSPAIARCWPRLRPIFTIAPAKFKASCSPCETASSERKQPELSPSPSLLALKSFAALKNPEVLPQVAAGLDKLVRRRGVELEHIEVAGDHEFRADFVR